MHEDTYVEHTSINGVTDTILPSLCQEMQFNPFTPACIANATDIRVGICLHH